MDRHDRREHLRRTIKVPVKVKVIDRKRKTVWSGRGTIANIGSGGVQLELVQMDKQIVQKLGEKEYVFRLAFSLPGIWLRFRVVAEVAWMKTVEESGVSKQRFGMAFRDVPKKREQKLARYAEGWVIDQVVDRAFQRAVEDSRKKPGQTE